MTTDMLVKPPWLQPTPRKAGADPPDDSRRTLCHRGYRCKGATHGFDHLSKSHCGRRNRLRSEPFATAAPIAEASGPDDRIGGMAELTDREQEILAFEREWWRYGTAKEQAVHDRFGMTVDGYYQALSRLLDGDAALAHDPLLVRRLRRLRVTRRRHRAARRTS
jgi:hypothetical protein